MSSSKWMKNMERNLMYEISKTASLKGHTLDDSTYNNFVEGKTMKTVGENPWFSVPTLEDE